MKVLLTSPTKADIAILCFGIIGVVSAALCFAYIYSKLKINHVIKKLLLFGTAQQAVGYGILFSSVITSLVLGFRNKLTCFWGFTSIAASGLGAQSIVSMISVIRYNQISLSIELNKNEWDSFQDRE